MTPTKQTLPAPVTEGDTTIKEAVTSVTWTADPAPRSAPGEFAEFEISAGPVPEVDSLEFPATQTYSDGTVVEWNEPTPASGEEPEHPVPTLTVDPAAAATSATASVIQTTGQPVTTAATGTETSSTPTVLAVLSLIVAAAALLVAAFALRRRAGGPGNPPRQG